MHHLAVHDFYSSSKSYTSSSISPVHLSAWQKPTPIRTNTVTKKILLLVTIIYHLHAKWDWNITLTVEILKHTWSLQLLWANHCLAPLSLALEGLWTIQPLRDDHPQVLAPLGTLRHILTFITHSACADQLVSQALVHTVDFYATVDQMDRTSPLHLGQQTKCNIGQQEMCPLTIETLKLFKIHQRTNAWSQQESTTFWHVRDVDSDV